MDNYNSHEGLIYCKPHFKQLFQPKAVLDSDEPCEWQLLIFFNLFIFYHLYFLFKKNIDYLKPELIIRESQPIELPADVVRGIHTKI